MIYVPTDPDEQAAARGWISARLPMEGRFDPATALPVAIMRGGDVAAVVVYSQHRGGNIEMTLAADTPRWATRETVSQLLGWPFTGLGVRRITAMCAADNARSRRLVEGLGFVEEGRLADWFEHDDAVVYGLTRMRWAASRWCNDIPVRKAA